MQKSASVQNLPQSLTSGHHGGAYLAQTLPNTRSQQNQFQFPTTELGSMAPISSQTPEQRPNHGHSRSTSFFSFRSKQSLSNQQNAHQRTTSLGAANGVVPGAAYSSPPAQYQGQPPPAQYHQAQQSMSGSTSAKSPLARPASLSGNMQSEPQPQPQPQVPAAPPPLHPEIRSVVQLTAAHAHKIYFSGPLVRRIERQADGQRPVKDEGWCDVWAQLGGTTLSIWDMAQIQEASKQGKEVPPTYVNTTDAFVQVLGSVTTPATATGPSKKYANVLTLNTAGSNLLLFSCPSAPALISWAAALRLSAWEKSRLEEIYTAHLIRITLNAPNAPSTLVRGRMEGWVRIRVAGQTDWKRMWMAVVAGEGGPHDRSGGAAGAGNPQALAAPPPKKKRMSNLFSRDNSSPHQSAAPMKPIVLMYASPKPKDKKKPLLTLKDVTQAFAVYPERPELISRSTLIKAEGTFGDEETAAGMKSREGWLLIMPELEGGLGQAAEMLKWVVALHDAFELYGRPDAWTWDPRDPISLMFAYPVGPSKDLLFLDRDLAETLDPRDEHTSSIRSRLIGIVLDRMRGHEPPPQATRVVSQPPTLPPIGSDNVQSTPQHRAPSDPAPQASSSLGPQLPPLSFSETASLEPQQNSEPITERNSTYTNGRVGSGDNSLIQPKPTHNNQYLGQDKSLPDVQEAVLDRPLNTSPGPVSPLQPLQFESVHNTESNTKLPSVENVVASTAPGRRSFDPPNGSFKAPLVSNASSVSNGEFTEGTINPADISLPLSPRESHRAFSPPQSQSPSPSPYTSVPTAVSSSSPPSAYSAGPPLTTVPRRSFSVLSSPYSALGHEEDAQQPAFDQASVLTSPHSPIDFPVTLKSPFSPHGTIRSVDGRNHRAPSSPTLETAPSTSINAMHSISEQSNLFDEAGALYYMQQHLDPSNGDVQNHRRLPTAISEEHDEDEDTSSSSSNHNSSRHRQDEAASPTSNETPSSMKAPVRQNTPMVFVERTSSAISHGDRVSPSRQGLGRKPSGARAQAKASSTRSHFDNAEGISSQQVTEEEETQSEDQSDHHPAQMNQAQTHPSMSSEDPDLDALAALSYLDVEDKPVTPKTVSIEPLNIIKAPSPPPASEAPAQFKSSFAPSKHAAERKAKAQAHQAAHHAATHKPGRANGKRKSKIAGAWNESSDEEEEEDDDDDDEDADSDAEPSAGNKQGSGLSSSNASFHQPQQNVPTHGEHHMESQQQQYSHIRPARTLPQIPANQNYHEEYNPPPRRIADQYMGGAPPPPPRMYHDGTQIRTQAEFPQPGAARQSVWSQVLDPGRAANVDTSRNDKFVQLEPAEAMTKAFTPQGLLSAGIQDKQDRSAKRQEELARETGASLINVPNKPPPPQMGLLGAITAHERERKREGGVGAALTEREREKRLAEDRQRRFDDHQRQQLDQMQQGGSMYGAQFPGGGYMNPMMMMNPMMGMNPMMTGGGLSPMMTGGAMAPMMTGQMGYPGMMPGYNPQHMFAAQHAAQAYQQAMMAFSVAGSQVGGDPGAAAQLNPAMTGGGMFDPRMSMMGMPMMGQMAPMITGMSAFDPRFPPNHSPGNMNEGGLTPPGGFASPGQTPSRQSSPAAHGSPLARPDGAERSSRPESPKPL